MSLQRPLRKEQDLGSAGNAVHHWWVQRLTSVALVPLAVWLLVSLATLPSLDFVTLVSWIAGPVERDPADTLRDHRQLAFELGRAGDPRGLCA